MGRQQKLKQKRKSSKQGISSSGKGFERSEPMGAVEEVLGYLPMPVQEDRELTEAELKVFLGMCNPEKYLNRALMDEEFSDYYEDLLMAIEGPKAFSQIGDFVRNGCSDEDAIKIYLAVDEFFLDDEFSMHLENLLVEKKLLSKLQIETIHSHPETSNYYAEYAEEYPEFKFLTMEELTAIREEKQLALV